MTKSRGRATIKEAEQFTLLRQHVDRPMHGVFFCHVEEQSLSVQLTFSFLKSAGLMSEMEAKVELRFKRNEAYLQNIAYNTVPMIIHGNGQSKVILNALGNYLARAWSPEEGCLNCRDAITELPNDHQQTYPPILIAIFIDRPTPFLEELFEKIYQQVYPKSKLHLFIHNSEPYHDSVVQKFIDNGGSEYKSIKIINFNDHIGFSAGKTLAMQYCLSKDCSGYFSVDSVAHLDNTYTLKLLVEQQRGIVGPLLVREEQTWSNFWGAVADNGYYARSTDYMDIIQNKRRPIVATKPDVVLFHVADKIIYVIEFSAPAESNITVKEEEK
ncbi:procollagen-lysine,2-oxoglutarate 5-dioxygenase 1-like [Diachasma alloeum]|uniref:procollagen-lysine,2-oxoglutarate 5-dioxygenase 1-like n=1 Tax=Diachasma alloeum TaxID=454923 RepID=UPI0010FB2CDF|nr:procollagen-lysine,2-oxoglutarate 5-dioxygenase 1-like [Diachasma alloeum]